MVVPQIFTCTVLTGQDTHSYEVSLSLLVTATKPKRKLTGLPEYQRFTLQLFLNFGVEIIAQIPLPLVVERHLALFWQEACDKRETQNLCWGDWKWFQRAMWIHAMLGNMSQLGTP